MQSCDTRGFQALLLLLLASCTSIPVSEESSAPCQLSASELRAVRANALGYLVSEWPVLEERCEYISDIVRVSSASECSIIGGPITADTSCDSPSHKGYEIVFVEETLEPIRIYWLSD